MRRRDPRSTRRTTTLVAFRVTFAVVLGLAVGLASVLFGASSLAGPAAPPSNPRTEVAAAAHASEADENEPPEPINWWHGLLGTKQGAEPSLLWRRPDEPVPYLAMAVNFAILVTVFVRFGRKPLAHALTTRKKSIMEGIDQAQKMKRDAESRLGEYQAKLDRIDEELERIRRDLREQGERDRERIVREANERRERLYKDATLLIGQEQKQMHADVLRDTVSAAMKAAVELVSAKLTTADQDRMAEAFLAEIGASKAGDGRGQPGSSSRGADA